MTTRTKSKPNNKPLATCGQCQFAHKDDAGDLLCWGSPPIMMYQEGGDIPVRGLPVNPEFPRCACFQPPIND